MARSSRLKVCLATRTRNVSTAIGQIDKTPSYDAMDGGHGSALDHRRQRRPVLGIQSRRRAGSLAVDQAFRTTAVELHHPVADDLHGHAADPCRLAPRRTLVNRRQRQKPPRLRSILRSLRRQAARTASKSVLSAIGMANIPPFATLNVWPAPSARVFSSGSEQSASTYPCVDGPLTCKRNLC